MKPSPKITLIAEIQILPGYEQIVKAAAEIIWIETRKEKGCEHFMFTTKQDDSNCITFIEVFKTPDDFEFHKTASHTVTFLALLKGKAVGDGPKLTFFNQYQ